MNKSEKQRAKRAKAARNLIDQFIQSPLNRLQPSHACSVKKLTEVGVDANAARRVAWELHGANNHHREWYLSETITCQWRGYTLNTYGRSGADIQWNHRLAVSGWEASAAFELNQFKLKLSSRPLQRRFSSRRKLCGDRTTAPCCSMQRSTIRTSVRWCIHGFRRILLYSLVSRSLVASIARLNTYVSIRHSSSRWSNEQRIISRIT